MIRARIPPGGPGCGGAGAESGGLRWHRSEVCQSLQTFLSQIWQHLSIFLAMSVLSNSWAGPTGLADRPGSPGAESTWSGEGKSFCSRGHSRIQPTTCRCKTRQNSKLDTATATATLEHSNRSLHSLMPPKGGRRIQYVANFLGSAVTSARGSSIQP